MIVEEKVRDYLESEDGPFTPQQLTFLHERGGFAAGGAISSIVTGREIRDIDLYFTDLDTFTDFLEMSIPLSISDKAILLVPKNSSNPPIQMIFDRFYDNTRQIFGTFDFTVCMGAYDFSDRAFYKAARFIEDNLSRTLRFNRLTPYPIMSMLRVDKYQEYGYTISTLEKLKIMAAIGTLSIDSLEDIQKQIGGMYGTHFKLQGVNTLDDFWDADTMRLTSENISSDSSNIFDDFVAKAYKFPKNIFYKYVESDFKISGSWADGIDYTPGLEYTKQRFIASKLNGVSYHGLGDRVVFLETANLGTSDEGWTWSSEYIGDFKVIGSMSKKEWMDIDFKDRAKAVKNIKEINDDF